MNKRGFTLVELITTFALTTVIIILLVNVIVVIKNTYSNSDVKTQLYINQGNLSNVLNSKINNDNLISIAPCSEATFCYTFTFIDGEIINLTVSNNKIKFGKFVYEVMQESKINTPSIKITNLLVSGATKNNSFLNIRIPIESKLFPNLDFGVNLVYPFNSNIVSLTV